MVTVSDQHSDDRLRTSVSTRVNEQVDAVFVLSVRSFHERIAHIERELGEHGIAFEWIFEHDADKLSPELIESTFAPSDMGRGQQSLVLKHIETWKRCVARGYRRVLVFEDDAILASTFVPVFGAAMREAESLPQPYMVYLGCGDNKYVQRLQPSQVPDAVLVRTDIPLPATEATVFDERAARLRLEHIERHRITRPADWLMRETDAAMGIAHYWLNDPIVEQGSMNGRFSSVLDRKRIRRGRAWSWLRFRWDKWRRRANHRALHHEPFAPIAVAPSEQGREHWAIATARVATGLAAIGTFTGAAVANIAAGLMVIAFLAAPSCLQRARRVWNQPLGRAVVVFLAVMLLAASWSVAPLPVALKAWLGWRNLLLIFIGLAIFDTRRSKLTFAAMFVIAATASTVASYLRFDFGAAQLSEASDVKGGIVLRNHVTQGIALTVGALLALVLLVHARRASWQRWACGAAAVFMVSNVIFVSYGRSGYLVLAIASIVGALGLWRGRARGVALLTLAILALAAVQFSPLINQRFNKGLQEMQQVDSATKFTSMGIRMIIWETSATVVRQAPLFGHGLGSFPQKYLEEVRLHYDGWRGEAKNDPHNQYMFILAEAGLLGLMAFAWLLFAAPRQPVRGSFRLVGLALLLAWCVTSLFSSHFHAFNEGHLIALLLGVCLAPEVASTHPPNAATTAARTSA